MAIQLPFNELRNELSHNSAGPSAPTVTAALALGPKLEKQGAGDTSMLVNFLHCDKQGLERGNIFRGSRFEHSSPPLCGRCGFPFLAVRPVAEPVHIRAAQKTGKTEPLGLSSNNFLLLDPTSQCSQNLPKPPDGDKASKLWVSGGTFQI